jgi:hypothetical protein
VRITLLDNLQTLNASSENNINVLPIDTVSELLLVDVNYTGLLLGVFAESKTIRPQYATVGRRAKNLTSRATT